MKAGPVIKAAQGHNRYCGPAALSALARIDTREAARVLREVSGKAKICGVAERYMVAALARLGFLVEHHPITRDDDGKLPTLAAWSKRGRSRLPYLVTLSSHYCVIQGRRYLDNKTGDFVPLRDAPNRRARVKSVNLVIRP